jgi:hypothetical protein
VPVGAVRTGLALYYVTLNQRAMWTRLLVTSEHVIDLASQAIAGPDALHTSSLAQQGVYIRFRSHAEAAEAFAKVECRKASRLA